MKLSRFLKTFCLCLAAAVCMTALSPALASPPSMFTPTDMEKLYAFWQQPAYDGMNNGEAVYDYELPEGASTLFNYSYGGSYLTQLVTHTVSDHSSGFYFRFFYYYHYSTLIDDVAADFMDPVAPDLYGDLDLAETGVIEFGSAIAPENYPRPHQTHITSVLLDNCEKLERVDFNAQDHCTAFSALGCPNLVHVKLLNGVFNSIAFDLNGEALRAKTFGTGSIGVSCDDGVARFIAYPDKESFLGWFLDGELISTELEAEITEAGTLTACFGGDADGDGVIGIADAVLALRASLDLFAPKSYDMLDIDGNGSVDVADAIMIARFTLGLI